MPVLIGAIERQLARQGGTPALLWENGTFSFRDLDAWSARLAAGLLKHGVRTGDRVAVGLPNSPELIATVIAVLRAGAILVPLNPAYTGCETSYIVDDSGATLVIANAAQGRALAEAGSQTRIVNGVEPQPPSSIPPPSLESNAPALIVYTSGTTGRPKGTVLTHHALFTNLSAVARAWQWTSMDRLLLTLPCFHLHGLGLGVLASLLVGSSIVLRPRFVVDEVLRLIQRHRCTMFFGVPTMYNRLVMLADSSLAGFDPHCMRLWVSGSAPLTGATFERFREKFGHEILERFGMSEGGFMIAAPYEGPRRPGVVGYPLPGIEVRLVDPEEADKGIMAAVADGDIGEIVIRGPNLFGGYWQRPDETRQAFVADFFRSGDLAVKEADGMIRIVGRLSVDVIKSRGFKISAVEVESCLQGHPAVAEVAVVGVPDVDRGETVVAVVVIAPGASASEQALLSFAGERLAPHKMPARVVFVDEIPRTGPGKFKKRELMDRLEGLGLSGQTR